MRIALVCALALASACAPTGGRPDFRAIGQEPGWHLEIEEGRRMTLIADYGERRVTAPAPAPDAGPEGRRVYRARTRDHTLTVTVEDTPCQDAMSGQPYPATVTVELDGRQYRGCGTPLPATPAGAPR